MKTLLKKVFLFAVITCTCMDVVAQAQEEFMQKLNETYSHAGDKKKALESARALYDFAERNPKLQTFGNYLMLKQLFSVQAPDPALAKKCEQKAEGLKAAFMNSATVDEVQLNFIWIYGYYLPLFTTKDPQNADNAMAFVTKFPSFQTFSNLGFIANAYDRNGDFRRAKQWYEKAMTMAPDDSKEYVSYLYYTNFLARSGEYLRAEEMIRKIEHLAEAAPAELRSSYKAELTTAKVSYYLAIGDYASYVEAAEKQYDYFSELNKGKLPCDPYAGIRRNTAAYAKEMVRDYDAAQRLYKSRDSVNYLWVNCHNKTYPNNQYNPISMYPVFLAKRGKLSLLPKPLSFFIDETKAHYAAYSDYADISVNYMKATQLGFLHSPDYVSLFKPVLEQVKNNKNFKESTLPYSNYAYFRMRDRQYTEASEAYDDLFKLNTGWINDVIFSFGEKAFVNYYNARLKEGYENYHSFVKLAREKQSAVFPHLAIQAYNNLLFTKSISLKGTQRRKEAFLQSNDAAITQLYDKWLDKKQQLIRQYMKTEQGPLADTTNKPNTTLLRQLQDEVNQLENELTGKAKDFKKYLVITPTDWKTVKAQLKEGEAAIEITRFQWRDQLYYSDTAYYAAYIITRNSEYPEIVYLNDLAAELDNKYYRNYKNSIRLKIEDQESYVHFWKPIATKLKGISKVYFSPDGIYHLINLSTLKNPETGKFVLDELSVSYTTSGADIRTASAGKSKINTAVLFGRPVYNVTAAAGSSAKPVADKENRSFVTSFRDLNIPDLPGTEEEVKTIRSAMNDQQINVTYYIKEQASEDKMYQLHSPDILHIATHGYWSPAGESPTEGYRVFNAMVNSGLLLTGVVNFYNSKEFPDTYDGILTAYEAQNLDLSNTSLVILSACETNLGYLDAGEGVYGLQRAFRTAGAGSIMTSLWKVDDNATKDFMIAFYRQFLKTNDKLASFRFAQQTVREKYPQPFFWGAFVMMGE